jgi:asparagine synthase (glutamine-hydrolysing)
MCGIAGVMRRDGQPPDPGLLRRLGQSLRHRGPDGSAVYIANDVGFVHTRLAIIDLDTGDQPLCDTTGLTLIANGEVYNFLALRRELGEHRFKTKSDCEPPLAAYADAAEAGLDRLRGMYAIALHDQVRGRLVLARDPFGIKPLYYCEAESGLAFASEPQALIATGLASPDLIAEKAVELLQVQFTTGPETIYREIRRVLPGETLVVERGRIVGRRMRDSLPAGGPAHLDVHSALAQLETVLRESVRLHLQSDVGYGLFLSGGIDSGLLLALIAQETGQSVQAYTAGFPGTAASDERLQASEMARRFGADHHEVEFTEADFWSLLPRVAAALDDPVADYATLPTFKMASLAASEQKVILSGEGGDEIFGGYGRYRAAMRPWWLGGKTARRRGLLDGTGVLRTESRAWRKRFVSLEREMGRSDRSRLQVQQEIDCLEWLPNDLLIKLDRCLMAHGLEGRTPYIDPQVAAFGFALPDGLKVHGRLGKWLMRQLLEKVAPGGGAFERKRGFTVPVGEWIFARDRRLGDLVALQPGVAELCHPDAVRAVFRGGGKQAGQAAWALLFFALWHSIHICGNGPSDQVEATLSVA